MDLTPEEIADKEFENSFALWSYDDNEVDEFLELVSICYEEALVKNKKLKEEMEDLKADLAEERQKIDAEKEEAKQIKEEAKEEAAKIINEAEEKAEKIQDEAELRAERIINQSKKRVEEVINIEKKVKDDFKSLFTYLLNSLEDESDLKEIEEEFDRLIERPEGEKWNEE